ncbi:hypothetical protein NN561_016137 [Cricetulus griseus]
MRSRRLGRPVGLVTSVSATPAPHTVALSPSCAPSSLAQSPFPFLHSLTPFPAPQPIVSRGRRRRRRHRAISVPLILLAGRADVPPRVLKQRLWGAWGRRGAGRGLGDVRDVAAKGQAQDCGRSPAQAAERGVRHGSSPSSVGVGRGEPPARAERHLLRVTQVALVTGVLQKGKLHSMEVREHWRKCSVQGKGTEDTATLLPPPASGTLGEII